MLRTRLTFLAAAGLSIACNSSPEGSNTEFGAESQAEGEEGEAASSSGESSSASSDESSTDADTDTSSSTGPLLDVGGQETTGGEPVCTVDEDKGNAPPPCDDEAPADSFTPEIQWSWTPQGTHTSSVVTPLVANLTDDDQNDSIDLCDVPDIVVVTYDGETAWPNGSDFEGGHLFVLDGASGDEHWEFPIRVDHTLTPALGDMDGDGLPEIVTATRTELLIINHDGTVAFQKPLPSTLAQQAIALADLDNDGDVEIVCRQYIFDHEGDLIQTLPRGNATAIPVDLDGDGDLEIVEGFSAWHHDGQEVFNHPGGITFMTFTAVADLDADGLPEIVGVGDDGIYIFEHDGAVKINGGNSDRSPPAIVDMDANGTPEIALVSQGNNYRVLDVDLGVYWSAPVDDGSGAASGTAFDFLGDGSAETMYADETDLFLFDENGIAVLTSPRTSWTQTEYPVVADVDNDASAEIVVVSNVGYGGTPSPTVQVLRDVDDRWVPARRIWNQHAYHVTNVLEDGRIPQFENPHWESFNTFRVNTQIGTDGGGDCIPPVD